MTAAPRFEVLAIDLFERDVRLRMPFRFGVVTLTEAPQAFVRARIRLVDSAAAGRTAEGVAAELLAPKWFDKNPALSNEDNFDQLRAALCLARGLYLGGVNTAFGHFARHHHAQGTAGAARGLNALVANYGPALIDRVLLDALCRALGVPFHRAVRENLIGLEPAAFVSNLAPDLAPDMASEHGAAEIAAFLPALRPAERIAARHTVGLVDPIAAADLKERVGDGLPETLQEVVATYGQRWFKLKVAGDVQADVARLVRIATVLDRIEGGYHCTLDGNEQYDSVAGVVELWQRMAATPQLAKLCDSVVFIEQPIKRQATLAEDITPLARFKPVIIDESDDSLSAYPRARALGYGGVSSKTCKGIYKSIINALRCRRWGGVLSAEDLTIQAGVALQQDLALVSLLGITHVERNGHHYVNGMHSLPAAEQQAFLQAHPDLYERSHGAVRVRIRGGQLEIGSLGARAAAGFACGAMPDWASMRVMPER
jgi:hypothetical protein